jgi:hypothetical protein
MELANWTTLKIIRHLSLTETGRTSESKQRNKDHADVIKEEEE